MSSSMRILLYAPINLNIVDGSSIWLRSVCELLSGIDEITLDVLLDVVPENGTTLPEVSGVVFDAGHPLLSDSGVPGLATLTRIDVSALVPAACVLDRHAPYDLVIVRGFEANAVLAESGCFAGRTAPYVTDIVLHSVDPLPGRTLLTLNRIMDDAALVLCQTNRYRALFEAACPGAAGKCLVLSPMIPDEFFAISEARAKPVSGARMVYAGKFHPDWGIDELFEVNDRLKADGDLDYRLDVYGDKIHAREFPGFGARTSRRLAAAANFSWHGATPRRDVVDALADSNIGYSMRSSAMDDIPEISTKVLEYAAAGVLPLINRSRQHEEFFGTDYPLFANSCDEAEAAVRRVAQGDVDTAGWQHRVRQSAEPHRMSVIRGRVRSFLLSRSLNRQPQQRPRRRRRLLIAGHDLKFIGHLRRSVFSEQAFDVRIENRDGFALVKSLESAANAAWAEVIFCEWALGAAVYYSRNKRPAQKLIVRFHRFELVTEVPFDIDITGVDQMVFVSEHTRAEALQRFGWPRAKTIVIPNSILWDDLDRPKTHDARFTLGIMGILPQLKRLDLAFDIIEGLRTRDPRYVLAVKGKLPWELPWLWKSTHQHSYFSAQFARMRDSALIRDGIIFDGFGADVAEWFRKIGWILSPSDVESFHLAAVEGMASRALPLVIRRPGAEDIFPKQWVFSSVDDMVSAVLDGTKQPEREGWAEECRAYTRRFDVNEVAKQWDSIVF